MKLHTLSNPKGAKHASKRLGCGVGSGHGKTSGRGHKGAKARSGGHVRPGFEGGQMPLYRRLPKRGFHNKFANNFVEVNLKDLERFDANAEITAEVLKEAGVISKICDGIVVLGNGEISKPLTVKAKKFTKSAEEKIVAAGGKVQVI